MFNSSSYLFVGFAVNEKVIILCTILLPVICEDVFFFSAGEQYVSISITTAAFCSSITRGWWGETITATCGQLWLIYQLRLATRSEGVDNL